MFSQRGVLNLAHTLQRPATSIARRVQRDAAERHRCRVPRRTTRSARWCRSSTLAERALPGARRPRCSRAAATARHDAVAWGFARAPIALRRRHHPALRGHGDPQRGRPRHRRRDDAADHRARARSASSSPGIRASLAAMAGLAPADREPPAAGAGLRAGQAGARHGRDVGRRARLRQPVRQGRAGDRRAASTSTSPMRSAAASRSIEARRCGRCVELFPIFSRLRMTAAMGAASSTCRPDASPIIGKTPVTGLYFNCGWGTGGFKATPGSGWVFAHTIARDEPHALNAPFSLERFATGRLIDEHGAGRGRALTTRVARMLLIPCPWCGPRDADRVHLRRRGASRARRSTPDALDDAAWGDYLFMRDNPQGRAPRALGARVRLPALVQRRARHRRRTDHRGYRIGEPPPEPTR